jgi:hypothetical protein
MRKHTPGPWKLVEEGGSKTLWSLYNEVDDKYVLVDASMSEGDARLISFAPQMYEALKNVVFVNDTFSWADFQAAKELLNRIDQ